MNSQTVTFVTRKKQREPRGLFGLVIMIALLVSATFIISAFQKPQEPTYSVKQTLKFWQATVECLKQSNAPSATTNALIEEISKQIDPILQAEQKAQDSINKSKPKPKN